MDTGDLSYSWEEFEKYGSWAIVTGSTDGIGSSFVIQLASRKINLVLVGRSPSKLKDVADEIQAKYKTQVKIVVVDFSGDLIEGMSRVEMRPLMTCMLEANNVGLRYSYARFFHEVDSQLHKNLIAVNVEGTTKMVHTVVPGMLKGRRVPLSTSALPLLPFLLILCTLYVLLPKHY